VSTVSGHRLTVSSWRWLDGEGAPCAVDDAVFRLWSVRAEVGRVGFLAMPVHVENVDVLIAAERCWPGSEAQ